MRRRVEALNLGIAIKDSFLGDSFFGMAIEGVQRVGKSSYASQAMAEAHGEYSYTMKPNEPTKVRIEKPNYEAIKKWVVFRPKEFLDVVFSLHQKEMALVWDDAGFWLFALDWYAPFVKSVSRYIQLCGRQFAALILTTPKQTLISQKVLEAMPDMLVCRIHELGQDDVSLRRKMREARVYRRWDYPDGKKGGVRKLFTDYYNAYLPDDYWGWYKPKSDAYMDIGLRIMKREATREQRRLDKREIDEQAEDTAKVLGGGEERVKELNEVIAQLEDGKTTETETYATQ